jgi:hypothetical protein
MDEGSSKQQQNHGVMRAGHAITVIDADFRSETMA